MSAAWRILDQILDDRNDIVGTSGSGKTYLMKVMAERLLEQRARVCIVDPLGVSWGLRFNAAGDGPGFPIVIFGGRHGDLPLTEHAGPVIAEAIAGASTPCIVDLSELHSKAAWRRFMTAFTERLFETNREPLHLVFDEADEWAPQRVHPEGARLQGNMDTIVRRGRTRGFIPWLITQRPAVISKDVLSQADTLIALKLVSSQDRAALGAWIEGQADRAEERRILAALPQLQKGEGFVWAPGRSILEQVAFPRARTFDSSRTPKRGENVASPTGAAAIDLDALRGRLATVEQEAVENDPKRLKQEIARLTRELAAKGAAPATDTAAIDAARQEGYERGYGAGHEHGAAEARTAILKEADDLIAEIAYDASALHTRLAQAAGRLSATKAPVQRNLDAIKMPSRSAPRTTTNGSGKVHGDLSRPQQRILDALAWLESVGIDRAARTQLAFLADASPKSSAFMNNLSALRTAGLIEYPGEGEVSLTPQGRRAANAAGAPQTTAELQAQVRGKVTAPQWRILEALIRTYPRALDRETLAERAEASPSSSAYVNNLGFLRSLGVIDYPGQGQVRAEPVLFLEERR